MNRHDSQDSLFSEYSRHRRMLEAPMKEPFKNAVRPALDRGAPLAALIDIVRVHKARGLTQDVAYDALQELRTATDALSEDRICELMDVISGFCQPGYRIWESTLANR